MNSLRKYLCAILSIIMVITAIPVAVTASAETEAYSSELSELEECIYSAYKNMDKTIYVYSYSARRTS